jgi:hypothetical protein
LRAFFFEGNGMWKIVVGFIVFAGAALFILSKGGDIDLSGEKHGEPIHTEAPAAAAPASAASAAK